MSASFFWLWWTTNLLSGLLAVGTIAFYVFVYTLLLKRRTSQNVVWGGAAGCMPVMIAWSAVTGTIGWPALAMFAIIFFWTPPHTWALAMRYKDDYKAAGVPMLPAVATERQVTKQILIYTWLTVAATLVLALAAGWLYTAVAAVAGVWFLAMAHQLVRRGARAASRSSRCDCSCSRTTIWRWCSARWRSIRRSRCRRCSDVRLLALGRGRIRSRAIKSRPRPGVALGTGLRGRSYCALYQQVSRLSRPARGAYRARRAGRPDRPPELRDPPSPYRISV